VIPALTYLACPYSHPDRKVRLARFNAVNVAAGQLMRQGHLVFSPISHTHPIAEAGGLPLGWEFWAAFDRAYLEASRELIVLRLDGWRESVGVTAELAIAAELGIPVSYIDPESAGATRVA
jgi:hypothetical protein